MFSTIRQEPKWNWTVLNMHNLAAEDELQYLEKYFQGFSFWRFPSHVIKNRIESFDADGVHFSLNTISKMAMVSDYHGSCIQLHNKNHYLFFDNL